MKLWSDVWISWIVKSWLTVSICVHWQVVFSLLLCHHCQCSNVICWVVLYILTLPCFLFSRSASCVSPCMLVTVTSYGYKSTSSSGLWNIAWKAENQWWHLTLDVHHCCYNILNVKIKMVYKRIYWVLNGPMPNTFMHEWPWRVSCKVNFWLLSEKANFVLLKII